VSTPLTNIESATVELRLSGGVTYTVEFQNAVVPLRGQLNIEVEPVEGPSDGGYRTFVSGPMLGDLTLSGFVKSAVRITAPAAEEQP
jgi:hypothetical protein